MAKFWQSKRMQQRAEILGEMNVSSLPYQSILPYHAYDESRGIFINDNSIGIAWELPVFAGANDEIVAKLADLLDSRLPDEEGWFGQMIRWGSNKVGFELDAIKARRSVEEGIYKVLAESADRYYRYAALQNFPNDQNLPVCLRDNSIFFFVSVKAGKDLLSKMDHMVTVREGIETKLTTMEIGFKKINAKRFIGFMTDILNHDKDDLYPTVIKDYDALNPLSGQIKESNFELGVHENYLELAFEKKGRTIENNYVAFKFEKLPQRFALWQGADSFARLTKPAESITCPYLYSITFRMMPKEKALQVSESRMKDAKTVATTALGKFMPSAREATQEWEYLHKEILEGNTKLTEMSLTLLVLTNEKSMSKDISQAENAFNVNGFKLSQLKYMQHPLFLSVLPFMMVEGLWQDFKVFQLTRMATTFNVVNLMPLVADSKIVPDGLLLPSFRNQVACFNNFSPDLRVGNRNMAVTAGSGSGKSFLVQALVLDVLSLGGRAWIIDKGESYKKLCKILGGTYIDSTNIQLNPFTYMNISGDSLENDAPVAANLIAVMASPKEALGDVQMSHLLKAVLAAYAKNGNDAKIDDVIDALIEINVTEQDGRIRDIATLLSHYRSDGAYGRYFNEKSLLDPNAKFTLLELSGIEKNEALIRPVLFSLILTIQQQMFQSSKSVPKQCVIDEAWALLSGDNVQAAKFIETGFRTARKHGGSFCTITQGLNDYFQSDESRTLWENAEIKWILKQEDTALGLKNNDKEILTPSEQHLIKGFQEAQKVGYASMMLKCGNSSSFHRLFADPFKRIMLSTEPNQCAAVESLLDVGVPLEEAVTRVARQYYGAEMDMITAKLQEVGYEA